MFAPHGAINSTLWSASRRIIFAASFFYNILCNQGKKCILRVRSLRPEQSEGNNDTSKIDVFTVSHDFFILRDLKMDFFFPHREIKSTLWPASRKKYCTTYYYPNNRHVFETVRVVSDRWVSIMHLSMTNLRIM